MMQCLSIELYAPIKSVPTPKITELIMKLKCILERDKSADQQNGERNRKQIEVAVDEGLDLRSEFPDQQRQPEKTGRPG